MKSENSTLYPHVSVPYPRCTPQIKPAFGGEKVGGPVQVTCRTACSGLSGTRPLGRQFDGDVGSTGLKGFLFFYLAHFYFSWEWDRGVPFFFTYWPTFISQEDVESISCAPKSSKLSFILRFPRSFLNVKPRTMTVSLYFQCAGSVKRFALSNKLQS